MPNQLFHLNLLQTTITPQVSLKTFFESLDGWNEYTSGTGLISLDTEGILLTSGNVIHGTAEIFKRNDNLPFTLTWDKPRTLLLTANITISTDLHPDVQIRTGPYDTNTPGFGFKFDRHTIYGFTANGTLSRNITLISITQNGWTATHKYKAVSTPPTKVEFYIDDVLKGTITDRLPSGNTDAEYLATIHVENDGAWQHIIQTGYTEITQDL